MCSSDLDNDGRTAVMLAARGGHAEAIRALAGLGADVRAADNDGDTALAYTSDTEVRRLLAELGLV